MLIFLSVLETDHEKSEFMVLYNTHHEVMLRIAKKYFPTDQMALEDAVQNAWIKIVKHFRRILGIECNKRGAYCIIIVKNECLSLLRKNKAELSFDELAPIIATDQRSDGFTSITQVIHNMPEKYRTILEMRFIEECSILEISQQLNIPEATVSTRSFRGRKLLIDCLRKKELV